VTRSGLELPLYGFHVVLGHSRDAFVRFCGSRDLVSFWACHRAAFAQFGGVPREILYDRTKTVVRTHVGRLASEGARFHPEALASAHHYGFRIPLCQRWPRWFLQLRGPSLPRPRRRPRRAGRARARSRGARGLLDPGRLARCPAAASRRGCCPTRPATRSRSRSCSARCPRPTCTAARSRSTRRPPVAELLSERIRRNARELKLLGLAEARTRSSPAPRRRSSATASSSTSCSRRRPGSSSAAATPRG